MKLDTFLVCPYCMNDVGSEQLGCCGESSAHFAEAIETKDGVILISELPKDYIVDGELVDPSKLK